MNKNKKGKVGLIVIAILLVVFFYFLGETNGIKQTQFKMVFDKSCNLVTKEEITNRALQMDRFGSSGGVNCDEWAGNRCLLGKKSIYVEERHHTEYKTGIKLPRCYVWVKG